ncbi:MAG: RNA polymerase sigma factor [Sedimentisphaerales bacterium]|nr:RNA polymerase sigma factor [Sedimentisphaerales bacterium]
MQEVPEDIIYRCQNGSATAFAQLVQCYERTLFAYVYRLNCTTVGRESEDIVQDIFLKVYQSIHNFKQLPGACFSTWLFTIARNHCIDLMRKKKTDSRSKKVEDKTMTDFVDYKPANPQKTTLQNETAEYISMAVAELSEPFRSALVLRYYEDASYAQIAQILQCNEGTAKLRVARAKQMLSKLLDKIR